MSASRHYLTPSVNGGVPGKKAGVLRALIAVLVCAALAGCGGSNERRAQPAPERRTEAERVAAAVREQAQAVARGNGQVACRLFSPKALREFEDFVSRRAGAIGCATAIREGARSLPRDVRAALERPVITSVEVHGGRATVKLQVPAALSKLMGKTGRASAGTPLRKIDGEWKVDALAL